MGTRHLYWISQGPSFEVHAHYLVHYLPGLRRGRSWPMQILARFWLVQVRIKSMPSQAQVPVGPGSYQIHAEPSSGSGWSRFASNPCGDKLRSCLVQVPSKSMPSQTQVPLVQVCSKSMPSQTQVPVGPGSQQIHAEPKVGYIHLSSKRFEEILCSRLSLTLG
jgi:hypothetical protein